MKSSQPDNSKQADKPMTEIDKVNGCMALLVDTCMRQTNATRFRMKTEGLTYKGKLLGDYELTISQVGVNDLKPSDSKPSTGDSNPPGPKSSAPPEYWAKKAITPTPDNSSTDELIGKIRVANYYDYLPKEWHSQSAVPTDLANEAEKKMKSYLRSLITAHLNTVRDYDQKVADNLLYLSRTKIPGEWTHPETGNKLYNQAQMDTVKAEADRLARIETLKKMQDYNDSIGEAYEVLTFPGTIYVSQEIDRLSNLKKEQL